LYQGSFAKVDDVATMTGDSSGFDHEVDVLVAGSGGGGMTAAITAKALGLDTVLIEKAEVFGGTTAISGGGVWVPNGPELQRRGEHDDPATVLAYLVAIVGDKVDHRRLERYVEAAPAMLQFLADQSMYMRDAFFWTPGYSDNYPDKGGNTRGRGLWAKPIDQRLLGVDETSLRGWNRPSIPGLPRGMWMTSVDLYNIDRIRWRVGGIAPYGTLAKLVWRLARARILGERMAPNGVALAVRLRLAMHDANVPLWLSSPMGALIVDDGRVVGVELEREGKPLRVKVRKGVIIATGGFESNPALRQRYQPTIGAGWTRAIPDNTGDGILAGEAAGAAVDLMDEAWWSPTIFLSGGRVGSVTERQYPGQFIVNQAGQRFANEAAPYTDFGAAQIAGQKTGVGHIPAWMVIDRRAWKRNVICGHFPGWPMPKNWLESGQVKKASTLAGLAEQIGVPSDALSATAERFNAFARQGRDEDFGRGSSAYDNYYGDPTYANPNLAEVTKPPFLAFQIFPGDLGTKGGLVTDHYARVLREEGTVINGLYACGNASAAVMGKSYAGPGATIGPAMTFGWVAAQHLAGRFSDGPSVAGPDQRPAAQA
jgi:3-oxosteroid 1-dehydrogenase